MDRQVSTLSITLMLCLAIITASAISSGGGPVALRPYDGRGDATVTTMGNSAFHAAYTQHSPIVITSNSDFATQGWPGSGTEADPYVIEGLNITSTDTCISISGTTVYFVIRGCLLRSSSAHGVNLYNVRNGRIENNTISNVPWHGVRIYDSQNNTVLNNTISGCSYGVYIGHSTGNILVNNTISDNLDSGVNLYFSSDNTLLNNRFHNNGIVFSVLDSTVEYWRQTIAPNNTVNGKAVGYFWNLTGGVIDGCQYGQVILANCTGVTVRDGVFSNGSIGIQLGHSDSNTLLNNTISNSSRDGVYLYYSSNNVLTNNTIHDNLGRGVELYYSPNSTLVNNTVSNNEELDVYIYYSSNTTLLYNTISHSERGVHLHYSSDNVVANNTISNNSDSGAYLYQSSGNIIANNTISDNLQRGAYIYYSSDNTLVNNTITDNSNDGVLLSNSWNNTLVNNSFENNGVVLYGTSVTYWRQTIAPNNTVNGKPVGYFWSLTGGEIDGSQYGQVILANCTGVTVRDGVFSHASIAVQLGHSDNNTIFNNVLLSNREYGVSLTSSSNNTVVNNTISNNYQLGCYVVSSSDNTLVNNTISNNQGSGVLLIYSADNTLLDNDIISNGGVGTTISYSPSNTLVNNIISNNSDDGINLSQSFNNVIVGNIVASNSGTGIYIEASSSNLLYRNWLDANAEGNARDDGSDNNWNTTDEGNYWSDYNGTKPYSIPGAAGSADYHPQPTVDNDPPAMDHPGNITYAEGTTGHVITWSPFDVCPDHYVVYRNGTLVASGLWNGSQISVSVDGLSLGCYNYTLVVYDEAGHSTVDTVFVTVVDGTAPTINHPPDVNYIEGTTGNMIIWNPSDAHPARYEIYRNGSLLWSGQWDGWGIAVNVNGLPAGVYNYTLVVYDVAGNPAVDTVFVRVIPNGITTVTTTTTTTSTTTTTTTSTTGTTTGGTTTTTSGESGIADTMVLVAALLESALVAVIMVVVLTRRRG